MPKLRVRLRSAGVALVALGSLMAADADASAPPTSPPPTPPPPTTSPAPSTTAPSAPAPTTSTAGGPSTSTAPPADLLAGTNWLQATVPSPCGDGTVQLVGGSAIVAGERVVLDDVRPLDPAAGTALAFLSCEGAGGVIGTQSAAVLRVTADGSTTSTAEQELPAGRILAIDGSSFTVESAEGAVPDGGCCAPLVRRHRVSVSGDRFEVVDDGQRSAWEQTVTAEPALAGNPDLVRSSVSPAALCYRWGDQSLYPQDPPSEPEPPAEPAAEVTTARLALIHATGRWIPPASEMTPEMGDVAAAFQEAQGLAADGVIGPQTARALAAALGCPDTGPFRQIVPPALGPRRFADVRELLLATDRYGATGSSGNPSLDALLTAAHWDGADALFLGCARRQSPTAGVTCTWSGRTPLQLVGLVDDPAADGVTSFAVLYARSAAPA